MIPSFSESFLSILLTTTSPALDENFMKYGTYPFITHNPSTLVHSTGGKVIEIVQNSSEKLPTALHDIINKQLSGIVDFNEVTSGEQKLSIYEGIAKAEEIRYSIEQKGSGAHTENILEEVLLQGREQISRIYNDLSLDNAGTKSWWKALIELIAIINFFTVLPWAYHKTIKGAKDGTGTAPVTFAAFTVSNGLGMTASIISWAPLLGAGYMVAFYSAIKTVRALTKRKKLNLNEKNKLEEAEKKIEKLLEQIKDWGFIVSDNYGHNVSIPYEYLLRHINFSVYSDNGRPIFISLGLLEKLEYSMQEIWDYYDEEIEVDGEKHIRGEVVSLFYTEPEQQELVNIYLATLHDHPEWYEALFYPTSKNGNKLALKYYTRLYKEVLFFISV